MKSKISILTLFVGLFLEINAQTDVKFNVIGLIEKKVEISAERYIMPKISLEINPEITLSNPIKTATISYWYHPRVGIGFGGRYYWKKKDKKHQIYSGLIFKYNHQIMGVEDRKIERTERFLGLSSGAKIRLNKRFCVDFSCAISPFHIYQYKDFRSNSVIKYVAPSRSSGDFFGIDIDFDTPSFKAPKSLALLGNISICYRL